MPQFRYVANDQKTGKQVTAFAEAESISALAMRLKSQELLPVKIYSAKTSRMPKVKFGFLSSQRVRGKELAIFTRQLATTLSAGLLLTEALETIAEDMENRYLQAIIGQIKDDIEGGADFSTALAKYPRVFPKTYTSIIRSGEATGSLDTTTGNLARYLENYERMKEKIKSAIRYPLFILGFALLVVFVIVFFLIPKFTEMFSEVGAQLPLLTRVVVGVSEFSVHNFPFVMAGLILLWIAYLLLIKLPKVQFMVDLMKLNIPIIGKSIIHKGIIAQFCRTLAFLIGAGVGLTVSFEITSDVIDHSIVKKAILQIKERVVAGASIADEIKRHAVFPKLVSKMASVGERTGELAKMLHRTADYYEDELEITLQDLANLLEPVLVIFIGGIVLVVVLALYLPIFHIAEVVR